MRALLVFLIVAGAAAYGFLVALHGLLPPANSGYATADRAELHYSAGHLSSWATYLSNPSISQQSIASNAANEHSGRDVNSQNQPSMDVSTSSENQVVTVGEPVQASQVAMSRETRSQPSLSSAPPFSTAMVEHLSPKTASPKRKARSRTTKPGPADNTTLATYGPQGGRLTPDSQRRGLGFFLFGRFAARD